MGEKYKNDLEDKNTPSKQSLADRFFKSFVENEDKIDFTNEDVIKEIKNLEKNLKKIEVLEIVLDCCSEEIVTDYIAKTLTTYEDFMDCFVFADALGSRIRRYLKGDLLNIYSSAEQWWHLIVSEDSLKDEYVKCMEDSLIEQIRKYGSYRNYLENVKPEETCASCGKELRENEGYYSRGDNVYCFLCKKELEWCKSCATYVRLSDFEGSDIACKYCFNPDGSFESQDNHIIEPDFEILDVLREREMIKKYENDLLVEKPYDDHDLADAYENIKPYSEKDLADIFEDLKKEEEEREEMKNYIDRLDKMESQFVIVNGKKFMVESGVLDLSLKVNKRGLIFRIDELSQQKGIIKITEIEGLESLTNLRKLYLNGNRITEIKDLGALTNLQELNLSFNEIREIKGLDSLKNLRKLKLTGNFITEIEGLESLTNLRKLYLNGNRITEIKGLEFLTNLRKLNLNGNRITEIKGLESLANLQELYIKNNQITEIKGLVFLTNLQKLNLMSNKITEIKGLESLVKLQELYLSINKIIEIKGLESLVNLITLELFNDYNLFLGTYPISEIKGLESLVNLQSLNLSGNQFSEIKSLHPLVNLRYLDLGGNMITEIKGLQSLVNLEYLDLGGNMITEIKGLKSLVNLEYLDLHYNCHLCNYINYITEIKGLESLTNLEYLDIHSNRITEIKGLDSLFNLQYLNLSFNEITEIKGLDALVNLEELYINENQITEIKGLESLINLRRLNLSENRIPEEFLEELNKLLKRRS